MLQGPEPFLYCDLYKRAHSEKAYSELSLQVWLLDERIDIISYNCIELMWYCVWLDHQQASKHICIEVAYGRGKDS